MMRRSSSERIVEGRRVSSGRTRKTLIAVMSCLPVAVYSFHRKQNEKERISLRSFLNENTFKSLYLHSVNIWSPHNSHHRLLTNSSRPQWPCDARPVGTTRTLGSRVRVQLEALMCGLVPLCCVFCCPVHLRDLRCTINPPVQRAFPYF
jgi:hypothetical protein